MQNLKGSVSNKLSVFQKRKAQGYSYRNAKSQYIQDKIDKKNHPKTADKLKFL